jgi:hypothetical protein
MNLAIQAHHVVPDACRMAFGTAPRPLPARLTGGGCNYLSKESLDVRHSL